LYCIRELPESLPDVVRRVGDAGFAGVEFAHRFREEDSAAVADALDETGLEPVGVHAELSVVEGAIAGDDDLLERCETVGCERVIVPHLEAHHFRSRSAVESLSRRLGGIAAELDSRGIDLGYHTIRHDLWPSLPDRIGRFANESPIPTGVVDVAAKAYARIGQNGSASSSRLDGTGLWTLFELTTPDDLFFELEAAEVTAAGYDPAELVARFGGRVELVHLRDTAPIGRFGEYDGVPHGRGEVDFEAVVDAASAEGVEWLVYEDELGGDPERILEEGATFLDHLLKGEERSVGGETTGADD
jgi:sugar phosphate isomerase/epimerase